MFLISCCWDFFQSSNSVCGILTVSFLRRHYSSLLCEPAFPLIPLQGDVTSVIPSFCAMEYTPVRHNIKTSCLIMLPPKHVDRGAPGRWPGILLFCPRFSRLGWDLEVAGAFYYGHSWMMFVVVWGTLTLLGVTFTWSAVTFRWLICVKVTSTRLPGPGRPLQWDGHCSMVLMWWLFGVKVNRKDIECGLFDCFLAVT